MDLRAAVEFVRSRGKKVVAIVGELGVRLRYEVVGWLLDCARLGCMDDAT